MLPIRRLMQSIEHIAPVHMTLEDQSTNQLFQAKRTEQKSVVSKYLREVHMVYSTQNDVQVGL